jgi:hypothetical protein
MSVGFPPSIFASRALPVSLSKTKASGSIITFPGIDIGQKTEFFIRFIDKISQHKKMDRNDDYECKHWPIVISDHGERAV